MPEIMIEISLSRSSGVLAGVVASLAQAGIELKSQKLQRASAGKGGWLSIVGEGDPPAPATLAERLNGTRGVDRLMRVVVDGEVVLAQGESLDDQIGPEDLAELSAGSKSASEATGEELTADLDEPAGDDTADTHGAKVSEDAPLSSGPEALPENLDMPTEPETKAMEDRRPPDAEEAEADLAAALETDDTETDSSAEAGPSATAAEASDPSRVYASLRRRRRRRK